MKINSLSITNLRALNKFNFLPGLNLNFILGPNGSGKTSLLESIYLLARAKSFRTNKNSSLIKQGEDNLFISAIIENQSGFQTKLTLVKTKGSTCVKSADKKQTKLSELARILPLGIITPDTIKLLQEGPKYRRQFLDWGVFHVEHEYTEVFKSFQKLLNQRNRLLRDKNRDCLVWDNEISKYAKKLDYVRRKYFEEWSLIFHNFLQAFEGFHKLEIELARGWLENTELKDILKERVDVDIKRGYTSVGPHRADLLIRYGKLPAKEFLSRGQIKILTILMTISQLYLFQLKKDEKPIILIDDLDAELDNEKQEIVLNILKESNFQTFITMNNFQQSKFNYSDRVEVFHVEHC